MKSLTFINTKKLIAIIATVTLLFSLFSPISTTFALDTTPPGITYTPLASIINQSDVPASMDLYITDLESTIVSATYSESGTTNSGYVVDIGGGYGTFDLSNSLGLHEYVITIEDSAGNIASALIAYTVITDSTDTIAPGIVYIAIPSTINQSAVPVNLPLTITDNVGVVSVTYTESGTTNSGTMIGSGDIYNTLPSNTLGLHEYLIIATDGAGNSTSALISYTVISDTVDVTPPVITYTPIASPIFQSLVPEYIDLLGTDNVGITSSIFSESGTTISGVLVDIGGGHANLTISNTLGLHTYIITTRDLAGNITITTISYTVIADTTDITPPVITYTPIASSIDFNDVPASIDILITDDVGIATAFYSDNALPGLDVNILGGTTTLNISNSLGLHTYIITASDSAGNVTTETISYTVITDSTDTTPPVITYTPIASPIFQSSVPVNIDLLITDLESTIISATYSESGTTNSGNLVPIGGGHATFVLSNSLGLHEYVITVEDSSLNIASALITYTVVADLALTSIVITPANPSILSGTTLQLYASGFDQNEASYDPRSDFTWTSDNTGVVSVNSSGIITGITVGTGIISATSDGIIGTTMVTVIESSGSGDTTPPVITYTGITSPIFQSLVPTSIPLTITDNIGIVSLVTFQNNTSSGTLDSPYGIYTLNISNEIGSHEYIVTASDSAGNTANVTITYTVIADLDTINPVITYTPIADQFNQSSVPVNIPFTITDNVGVTSVVFSESGTTNSGTLTGSGDIYDLVLSNSIGFHEYVVTASDSAGNTASVTISYLVFEDGVLNNNILGYNLYNLTSTGLVINWNTSLISSESLVDFYANGTQLLDQVATISGTLNSLSVNNLTPNKTYSVVIKSKVNGQENFTTLTIVIKTALSQSGLVINKIESILGNSPVVGGDFSNGYHFRFHITANNLSETGVTLKLADWTNGNSILPIAPYTLMSVSANGFNDYSSASGSTIAVTNAYGALQNISSIDSDSNLGGRQCIIDLFYKIPVGAQGNYGTTYGIKTQ
ncbi:MAG: Ig-like domain-containing protein [Candidatus Gracilibacteria bacterium]|nr:Ig-like domain-containing protein [Candidatus Gracilibacteria bacterium]MDD2908398.1 Ig-like domain-containing protein [Candidatus Gracilibacteria bacterium]